MKMMLSALAAAVLFSGVFSQAFAADDHAAAHGDADHAQHKSIGEPQPVANPALATRPGRVSLIEPKALSKVKAGAVTLKWNPVEGVESYTVQIATDPRFKWFVANEQFVKADSFQTPALEVGTYYWRVAAKKPGNDAGATTGFFTPSSFEVQ